jgi:CRISPR type III-B/RAMP module-associated protein Cmr3
VDEGRLYAESGIYLKSVSRDQEQPGGMKNRLAEYSSGYQGDLALTFELDGLESGEALNPCLYLGGERRRVDIETPSALPFPACPDFLDNQAFVKLVLITHGDFESWAPSFLVPDGRPEKADWVKEPVSGVTIRLRSAVVKGWDPVSGWDYASRKQKAFRKLVPPGSVYLVELQHPEESGALARALWGESLCPKNSQAAKDGYGQILIAKNTIK